ncbi:uncharacterized protein LOC107261254 [Ricinus communis]|uniref:uncharacterized protein LOC107261254 n=1 Tax=Ricinus communis TaxID=3988 RepID=UPI00201AE9CB|nr:uncharacterized protein LOC107261254 [Ricinus communis]
MPNSEYFTLYWHDYRVDVRGEPKLWDIGAVDFYSLDKISRIEINSMARELGLNPEPMLIMWKDPTKSISDRLRSLETDKDALEMAMVVEGSQLMHIFSRDKWKIKEKAKEEVSGGVKNKDDGSCKDSDVDSEDSEFVDSDYDLRDEDVDDDAMFDEFVDKELEMDRPSGCTSARQPAEELSEEIYTTVYGPSYELVSCSSSEHNDAELRKQRWHVFNEETDMENPWVKIGMLFSSFKQFKDAVKSSSIKSRNQVIFGPNTRQKCKASDRHVNANWIAEQYVERFRADPGWAIQGIIQAVKEDSGIEVSRLKAWRARNAALTFNNGDETEQLSSLHDYKLELLRSNPGSTIVFGLNEGVFNSMYVCFAALREGFKFCRPFISLDGCWLKGVFGGQFLTAVGLDANDCIYPIAWCVVQKENKENWKWFLELLAQDVGITNSYQWVFMTDRQKGLIPAIEELFPNSEHRFCVRHVHNNFRKKFNSLRLKKLVWGAAKASYVQIFQRIMEKFAAASHHGHNYMNSIPPHHWSRSHFRTDAKCDMLLNNLCECFNSFILDARSKGVIAMNEVIRTKLMKRIHKNRDAMKRVASAYCPRILKKLEKNKEFCWMFTTEWSGGERFQVVGPGG